jgi:cytosine/adenosine deaminase-related metal-dependent hydrolase
MRILTAEVVYTGLGTPRANGAVVLQGEGKRERVASILSREEAHRLYPATSVTDIGFAISPPPVNAHTHLDLSTLPPFRGPYEDFIRHVIRHRSARGVAAADAGLAELQRAAPLAFGDIVASEAVMRQLLQTPGLRGVAYWEVFEPDPAKAEATLSQTVTRLREFRRLERPDGLKLGLSPHTPHTVSAPLLQKLTRLAVAERLPLQIHVAESPAELALHRSGSGPLFELMRPFLGDWRPSGLSPVQYLARLGVLEARPTLVHMVHVDEEDVKAVAKAGCTVVHCPRSNEALQCGRFPWELLAKHSVEVAFGTDSKGSSPDLDVTREVWAARALHGQKASPLALVRAAVKGGARALGLTPPRFGRGSPASALYVWNLPRAEPRV